MGWLCLQCLQGLRGLLGQQEKELQYHGTEMLKSFLWIATRKPCAAPPCVLVGRK